MEWTRLEISVESTKFHTPVLKKSLLGGLLRAAHLPSLFFTHSLRTWPTCILQKSVDISETIMARTMDSFKLQYEVYWNKLFFNILRNLLAGANSYSSTVEKSWVVLRICFPNIWLSGMMGSGWSLMDARSAGTEWTHSRMFVFSSVPWVSAELLEFSQFCESQPLGICRAAQGHCFDFFQWGREDFFQWPLDVTWHHANNLVKSTSGQ